MTDLNLIRKIAWSFHFTTGIEWEELFQEAALSYFEALDSYNPDKGKLSVYVWVCMTRRLQRFLQEQDRYKIYKDWRSNTVSVFYIEETTIDKPVEVIPYWETLTPEAHEIAKVILSNPKPFLELRNINKVVSRIKHIMKNNDWDWKKTRYGIEDLRKVYSK